MICNWQAGYIINGGQAMKMKGKILCLCVIPVVITGLLAVIIGMFQYSSGMYSEIRESLKASAIAALNVYNSNGYGNYSLKDGSVWRGMNFNVSEESGLVDSIKEETGVDITFFFEDTAAMTSMTDDGGGRYIGMRTGNKISEYTLQKGAQMYYKNIDIGGSIYHAYIIPVLQPDTGEVTGALMATRSVDRLESVIVKNTAILITVMIVLILLIIVCAMFFVNAVVKEIHNAGNIVKKVSAGELGSAGTGNKDRKDELGELGRDIDTLQDKLKNISSVIKDGSMVLTDAAKQLDVSADNTLKAAKDMSLAVEMASEATAKQAEESQEVSKDMNYMGGIIGKSIEEIKEIRALSTDMYMLSNKTADILRNLDESSSKAKESLVLINKQTDITNASAQNIKSVAGFITTIAEQTSLLALNASIEAAKAGGAGKGFSVVALEIQKLAEQTNNSAREIKEIVMQLVSNTEYSVSVMEQVKADMEEQGSDVSDTQDIFRELEENILVSTEKINSVSEMTNKIDDLKQDMTSTIEGFSEQAENNAAATEETSAMTSQLADEFAKVSQLASQLQKLASQMDENIAFFH